MKHKTTLLLLAALLAIGLSSFSSLGGSFRKGEQDKKLQDSLRKKEIEDSLFILNNSRYKLFKKNAHASYYADKLNGRRTASGRKFDNKKYTAAHRKFPFGTFLRITNEANGKSVIVMVTDRGPFTRGREIDLTKRAFMDIASAKYGGSLTVTIEEVKTVPLAKETKTVVKETKAK